MWVSQFDPASGSEDCRNWPLPLAPGDRKLLLPVTLKGSRLLSHHLGCIYRSIFDHWECFNVHQLTFYRSLTRKNSFIHFCWLQYLTYVHFGWNPLRLEDADVVLFESKFSYYVIIMLTLVLILFVMEKIRNWETKQIWV